MMPFPWLKAAPWLIAGFFALAFALVFSMYLDERDQFTIYKTSVKTLGEQAEQYAKLKEQDGKNNLEKVKADHESKVPEIRNAAVANYLRRMRGNARSGEVPSDAASLKMDDGAKRECVPDRATIETASEDVAKLEAWRGWCELNGCVVE